MKTHFFRVLAIALAVVSFSPRRSEAGMVLAEFGSNGEVSFQNAVLTSVNDATRGSGISDRGRSSDDARLASVGFNTTSAAEVFAMTDPLNNDFFEFSLTSDAQIDLSELMIRFDRNTSGPTGVALNVSSSSGGFDQTFSDPVPTFSSVATANPARTFNLSGLGPVTDATFRFAGFNAESATTGKLDLRDIFTAGTGDTAIQISGNVTAVPEYSSLAMVGLALCGGLATYRLRSRQQLLPALSA